MEQRGYESIGCYTYYLMYDIDLGFRWSNFKKKSSIIEIRGWIGMDPKGCESIGCWTQVVSLKF